MEVVSTSETSVGYETTPRNVTEDCHIRIHCCENLNSHEYLNVFLANFVHRI
jgi:hypothetical protein